MARVAPFWVVVAAVLASCAGPVSVYHEAEGGEIATSRQPPPGADLPYPNLASVPAAPVALNAGQNAQVTQRMTPGGAAVPATDANQGALAGLELPGAAPPAPDVGLAVPSPPPAAPAAPAASAAGPAAQPPAPATARPVEPPPVAVAFAPGSAIVSPEAMQALAATAQARGAATVLAAGFGEQAAGPGDAALNLGLRRARAIADALTAAGVPPAAITLQAGAAGSGGFVQLVY